jgi:hypothetical protein
MGGEQRAFRDRFANFGNAVAQRHEEGRAIFGLPSSFRGHRWLSREGTDSFALAHGEPRPDPGQLITIGVQGGTNPDERGRYVDIYGTLATQLLLAERSRNDSAFQYETRNQELIDAAFASLPGPEVWEPTTIDLDGGPAEFLRCERGGDWIAFRDIGDGECLWVHVEQPDNSPVSIITIDDIAPYLNAAS